MLGLASEIAIGLKIRVPVWHGAEAGRNTHNLECGSEPRRTPNSFTPQPLDAAKPNRAIGYSARISPTNTADTIFPS